MQRGRGQCPLHFTCLLHAATAVARAAAEAAGVRAAVVELATSHADGAGAAEGTADARHNAALLELVLVGDLAAEAAAHEGGAAEASKAHHAVVVVLDAIDSVALAADLAAEAAPGVEALRDVAEATEGGVDVGHL